MQAFEHTEGIGVAISHRVATGKHQTAPRTGDERQWRVVHVRVALVCEVGEKPPGGEEGLARLGPVQRDRRADRRQDTADALRALHEFRVIPIVGRTGEGCDLGASVDEPLARNLGTGLTPDRGIATLLIAEERNGLPELERRGLQIAPRASPFFLALTLGRMDDICHHKVAQSQGIIHCNVFAGMGKGQQGGQPSVGGQPCNGLGARRRPIPGSITEAIGRQVVERQCTHADSPNLVKAVAGSDEGGAPDACWRSA